LFLCCLFESADSCSFELADSCSFKVSGNVSGWNAAPMANVYDLSARYFCNFLHRGALCAQLYHVAKCTPPVCQVAGPEIIQGNHAKSTTSAHLFLRKEVLLRPALFPLQHASFLRCFSFWPE
jgi:hypothetical protein